LTHGDFQQRAALTQRGPLSFYVRASGFCKMIKASRVRQ
jgi:hypothetical protein